MDDRLEQFFLVLEVDIERALGHAGCTGDFAHAGGVESLRQEDGARPIQDLAALGTVLRSAALKRADRNGCLAGHGVPLSSGQSGPSILLAEYGSLPCKFQ